jgi:hypothetical protein
MQPQVAFDDFVCCERDSEDFQSSAVKAPRLQAASTSQMSQRVRMKPPFIRRVGSRSGAAGVSRLSHCCTGESRRGVARFAAALERGAALWRSPIEPSLETGNDFVEVILELARSIERS